MNAKELLKCVVVALLFSSCNGFDKDQFFDRCSHVVKYSVEKEEDTAEKMLKKMKIIVGNFGNRPEDMRLIDKANYFYSVGENIITHISNCENVAQTEKFLQLSLDSLYRFDPKCEEIKQLKTGCSEIFSASIGDDEFKIDLILTKIKMFEMEIIIDLAGWVGGTSCGFDFARPSLVFDTDTVSEGDSLSGKAFILYGGGRYRGKMINKVEVNNNPIEDEKYYNKYKLSIPSPTKVVFDEKGNSTQSWQGKVYVIDMKTLEDTVFTIEREYSINKPCADKK